MKIYVSHSSNYDFKAGLYEPLSGLTSSRYEFFLPHQDSHAGTNTRQIIQAADLILAEVSYPSTGQGIELGWANVANIPVVCIYGVGAHPSGALGFITNEFIVYENENDLVLKLKDYLKTLNK